MKKRLTSLFLLFAFSGVLAGMPFHSGNTNHQMMSCCKKAKSAEQSPEASIARLCCALNCTNSAPTSLNLSFNFSPSIIIGDSIIKQIALLLFTKEKSTSMIASALEPKILPSKILPKYIQHHSFLI
jgi:hypothetical protein